MAFADNVKLLTLFGLWYLGNYYYNIYNKVALNEGGGKTGPHAYTISCIQLGVGTAYAVIVWLLTFNPITMARQKLPQLTVKDIVTVSGVAFFSAFAHLGSVLTMNAGSVAFGQIVKAAEPVFSAAVNTVIYSKPPTLAKALMLPVIVLGVAIACLKPDKDGNYKVDFEVTAVVAGSVANLAAAFRGSENARLMSDPGLKVRRPGQRSRASSGADAVFPWSPAPQDKLTVGNQFALSQVLGFIFLVPVALFMEGPSLHAFFELLQNNEKFRYNVMMSGLTFYGYNELSTMTIKHTSAVTASVANTAKRVIVIVGSAIALGNPLTKEEVMGSAISISGVFLYSIANQISDALFGKKEKGKKA